jgi:hypothetical protein
MLDLQPLIARLVDDVFRLIRGASVGELRELLGQAEGRSPVERGRRAERSKSAPARKAAPRPRREPAVREKRARPATVIAPEASVHAEITDPEWLLGVATPSAPTRAFVRNDTALVAVEESSPSSGQRPASRASVGLRSGESMARASERGGVVIRRKRA